MYTPNTLPRFEATSEYRQSVADALMRIFQAEDFKPTSRIDQFTKLVGWHTDGQIYNAMLYPDRTIDLRADTSVLSQAALILRSIDIASDARGIRAIQDFAARLCGTEFTLKTYQWFDASSQYDQLHHVRNSVALYNEAIVHQAEGALPHLYDASDGDYADFLGSLHTFHTDYKITS